MELAGPSRLTSYFHIFLYVEGTLVVPFYAVNFVVVVVVVVDDVYFILSRLLYLAHSANLGLLCITHPGMGPSV